MRSSLKYIFQATLLSALLFLSNYSQAQNEKDRLPHQNTLYTVSLLPILEFPFSTLEIGVEHPIREMISLKHSLGLTPSYSGVTIMSRSVNHVVGLNLREEVKFYGKPRSYNPNRRGESYVSIEGFWKGRFYQEADWLVNEGGAFRKFEEFNRLKNIFGLSFKIGQIRKPKKPKNIVWTEQFMGFGIRHLNNSFLPFIPEIANLDYRRNSTYPMIFFGLALGIQHGVK